MSNLKISYLVTVKNETRTLKNLLTKLVTQRYDEDEIVILDDFSDNDTTKKILEVFSKEKNVHIHQHSLNKNYGLHKNYGITLCHGDWIFQCDADELPSDTLIFNLREIILTNTNIELIYVPRINDFIGVTKDEAAIWGWKLNMSPTYKRDIVNWPDFQGRIFKKDYPRIHFERKLHEKIEGHNGFAELPKDEDLALYHDKTIQTQHETNVRYNKEFSREENMGYILHKPDAIIEEVYTWDIREHNNTLPRIGDIIEGTPSTNEFAPLKYKVINIKSTDDSNIFKITGRIMEEII